MKKIKIAFLVLWVMGYLIFTSLWNSGGETVVEQNLALNAVNGGNVEYIAQRSFLENKKKISTVIVVVFLIGAGYLVYGILNEKNKTNE